MTNSCDPAISVKLPPILSTSETTLITYNTATSGGNISSDNGFEVTARGVCWSLKPSPTIEDSITKDAAGTGTFTSAIKNLTPDTTYYVRAYATNKDGTAYGLQVTFKTLPAVLSMLTTTDVTNITATTAQSGGNVTSDGGSAVFARGVCWNTAPDPTINNNKTLDVSGTGVFTSNLTNLTGGTYYIRAYATNSVGTSYGNQQVFAVAGPVSTVTDINGNVYHTVIIGTQTWLVENLKTTKYLNGENISNVTDNNTWSTTTYDAWCDYNNIAANGIKYGHLYNWYAVNNFRKIAPAGWHIPSIDDLRTLSNYVYSHSNNSGSLDKALASTTDWATDSTTNVIGNNLSINNSSGFTALPGGYRSYFNGAFYNLGVAGHWWTSSTDVVGFPLKLSLYYNNTNSGMSALKLDGYSVRCVRDN